MVVKKKAASSVDCFIEKGADVKVKKEKRFLNILVRMPEYVLYDLDVYLALNKPWVKRTQWIVDAIFEKLNEEKEENGQTD